jgi:hypothetical protein
MRRRSTRIDLVMIHSMVNRNGNSMVHRAKRDNLAKSPVKHNRLIVRVLATLGHCPDKRPCGKWW